MFVWRVCVLADCRVYSVEHYDLAFVFIRRGLVARQHTIRNSAAAAAAAARNELHSAEVRIVQVLLLRCVSQYVDARKVILKQRV
jgi:hypothetical protein